jgi:hypothetical protein
MQLQTDCLGATCWGFDPLFVITLAKVSAIYDFIGLVLVLISAPIDALWPAVF